MICLYKYNKKFYMGNTLIIENKIKHVNGGKKVWNFHCVTSWTSKTIFELSLLGIPVPRTLESHDIFGDLI